MSASMLALHRSRPARAIKPDRATQREWDQAATLIDELSDLISDIPRATCGHPDSLAQFQDVREALETAVSGLRAIRKWEVQRFNAAPIKQQEGLS